MSAAPTKTPSEPTHQGCSQGKPKRGTSKMLSVSLPGLAYVCWSMSMISSVCLAKPVNKSPFSDAA